MISHTHIALMMMNDSLIKLYRMCTLSWAVLFHKAAEGMSDVSLLLSATD